MSDEFSNVPLIEVDVMNQVKELMAKDTCPHKKVNLAPGTYRDETGKPWLLPSFQEASRRIHSSKTYNHEYLPLQGHANFLSAAKSIALGSRIPSSNVCSLQTTGGTGAVHMAAAFLSRHSDRPRRVYISDPTWVNHRAVLEHTGWEVGTYSYYDSRARSLDFDGMMRDVLAAERGSIVVLHAVGHNPTGCDPTMEQWNRLGEAFLEKGHYAFFDSAYQGFVSGDFEADRRSVELFYSLGIPMCVCQSFSKNAGLYGQRLGALHMICASTDSVNRVKQHLKVLTRKEISCAPKYPADLVAEVSSDPGLMDMWRRDIQHMSCRIMQMRKALSTKLKDKGTPGLWEHFVGQRGMFGFSGLSEERCWTLIRKHHIYLAPNGRINVAGLNEGNLDYVVDCVDRVVREIP